MVPRIYHIVSQERWDYSWGYEPPDPGADIVTIKTNCTRKRDILALAAKTSEMSDAATENRGDDKPPWYGWTVFDAKWNEIGNNRGVSK